MTEKKNASELIEGRVGILAALQAGLRKFDCILLKYGAREEKLTELMRLAAKHQVPVRRVAEAEIDALTHGKTHGGIVALCSEKPVMGMAQLADIAEANPGGMFLLLEGIDDARNLGFVLRTADALKACAVLVKKHAWDFDATEVARPASGAIERLPVVQIDDIAPLLMLQSQGFALVGLAAGAKTAIWNAPLSGGVVLAVGGEKRGLSGAVRDLCDQLVRIPTAEGRSLSLSHAAAIAMGEGWRQRSAKPTERGER